MPFILDYDNKILQITTPDNNVKGQDLHDFVEDEGATPYGMAYPDDGTYPEWQGILRPEGKIDVDPITPGVKFSQIILLIHPLWQIQFYSGSGVSRLTEATIVGGVSNNPVKASGNGADITYFVSPVDGAVVVTTGGSLSVADLDNIAEYVWAKPKSEITTVGSIGVYVLKKLQTFVKSFIK